MNPVIEQLQSHRSIRKFTGDPLPDGLLDDLIRAGQGAASSSFLQGVTVVRVTDPALRAGLSVTAALQAAGTTVASPGREDLADIGRALDSGVPAVAALDQWGVRRRHVPGVRLAAVALGTAAEAGSAVSQAIDSVADTLRSEQAVAAEVRSLASQAQASAWLVAVLPVGFGLVASAADPATLAWLVTQPLGRACLVGGLALDLGALVWMRRIVGSIR